MNEELLQKLASPVYEIEEAQDLMRQAGAEIVRLNKYVAGLHKHIYDLKDQNDRLCLDLGLKDQGYTQ